MQFLLKIILSITIILVATAIGKKLPSTAGLVSVMPLTGVLVLVWMYLEYIVIRKSCSTSPKELSGACCPASFFPRCVLLL